MIYVFIRLILQESCLPKNDNQNMTALELSVLCLCITLSFITQRLLFILFTMGNSLSELREYTVSLADSEKEEEKQEHGSPQASGVSGQSVISLLSPEELAKLIEEVKSLDEATLKVNQRFFLCDFQRAVEWMCLLNLCDLTFFRNEINMYQ